MGSKWGRDLTPELACGMLAAAELDFVPSDVRVEARDERWLVRLPGQRVAWFAASPDGVRRLRTERRVLRLLEARCTFRVPHVVFESTSGELDVRVMVPGAADPRHVRAEVRDRVDLAVRLGTAVGTILSEQHSRIDGADAAGWLPRRPSVAGVARVGPRTARQRGR